MSEYINNKEHRKKALKSIIAQLHEGKSIDEVKGLFEKEFENVSANEISAAEQALISEGVEVGEIQKLCDVHAAVFKGSIEDIHKETDQTKLPGHPIYILKKENRIIETWIEKEIRPFLNASGNSYKQLIEGMNRLSKIDIHYSKKENLFFPYMEKYGITAPPKVMWGVDDEIRGMIKNSISNLVMAGIVTDETKLLIESAIEKTLEMIYKEENIMLPMLIDALTQEDWKVIANESKEIGYLYENVSEWNPVVEKEESAEALKSISGSIMLPSGVFKVEELTHMLNALPFDITFVDKDDKVKFFSQGKDRVFARTKAIIGRDVSNCHPPASVHVVQKIVEDFKSGKKDHEDFWIKMGDRYVYIRYFAVRGDNNEYLGVVEVTQNIAPIQELQGEKRLMSD
ncbi:MAG: DUF438 domain-containing protein [Clostridia bacterium]|jgi:hypothetical protein|nr:DUF438 domain-containing protein [Clostridia bacterium]